ncbi:hypothetical protein [Asticcacaulis solisilvae]|uniref:hypothetical protein n=1 Tax=Asticcacaulis solisilvae TaxID=1217274 RepID=UPI003FD8115E
MRTLISTFAVAAMLAGAPAFAQTAAEPQPADACQATACRTGGFDAVVLVDKDHYRTVPITHSPYVLPDGSILIFPGETIAIQFRRDGDTLSAPTFYRRFAPALPARIETGDKVGDDPANAGLPVIKGDVSKDKVAGLPPDTLLLSYGQANGQPGMMLFVDHTFARTLKLDATMSLIGKGRYEQRPTSTCPILPGVSSFESWPNPLGPMILKGFRLLPASDKIVCQ